MHIFAALGDKKKHIFFSASGVEISIIVDCFDKLNPLSANPEKWSNTLKQIVGNLPTICLSVFDHFMNLVLKGSSITNFFSTLFLVLVRALLFHFDDSSRKLLPCLGSNFS